MSAIRCWVVIEHDDEGRIYMVRAFEEKPEAAQVAEKLIEDYHSNRADPIQRAEDMSRLPDSLRKFREDEEWRGFSYGVCLVYSA